MRMKMNDEERVQISIRIPRFWGQTADRIASKLSRPGFPVTRAEAYRVAIEKGFVALADELKVKLVSK